MRRNQEALNIHREPFVLRSAAGRRLVGLVEAAEGTPADAPVIIIVPGLLMTLRQYFVHSWYLLQQGLRVVRYDATCHPGASDGEFPEFTSQSAVEDLRSVCDYVTESLRPPRWGVTAPSLAFRIAVRALSTGGAPALLLAIVGAVNIRASMARLIGVDLFQDYEDGRLQSSYNLFGYHGTMRPFIEGALQDDFVSLESAQADLLRCRFPIVHLAAEKDPWVELEEVERAYRESEHVGERRLLYLPEVQHDLAKNPVAAALALAQMVVHCVRYVGDRTVDVDDVVHPNFLELVRLNRLELDRERAGYWPRAEAASTSPLAPAVASLLNGQQEHGPANGKMPHG